MLRVKCFQRDDARSNTYEIFGASGAVPSETAIWAVKKGGHFLQMSNLANVTHVSARRGEVPSTGAVRHIRSYRLFYLYIFHWVDIILAVESNLLQKSWLADRIEDSV